MALEFASQELQADASVVKAAVSQVGEAICLLEPELRNNRELALLAVSNSKHDPEYILQMLPDECHDDFFVLRAVVSLCGQSLRLASPEMLGNRDIVLAAVSNDGSALFYASNELKRDPEIVQTALQSSGLALEHAPTSWRANRDIVRDAIAKDAGALEFAAAELQADKDIVLLIARRNIASIAFASEDLRNDPCFLATCIREASHYEDAGFYIRLLGKDLRQHLNDLVETLWKVHHLDISSFFDEAAEATVFQFVQERREEARQVLHSAAHIASGLPLRVILEYLDLAKSFKFLRELEFVAPLIDLLVERGASSSNLTIRPPRTRERH